MIGRAPVSRAMQQDMEGRFISHHMLTQAFQDILRRQGEEVYSGRYIELRDNVTFDTPKGPKTREVIIRDTSGVIVIPIDDNGRMLFVLQYREPVGSSSLELPGGGILAGETPQDAAIRESAEEGGFAAIGEPRAEFLSYTAPYSSTDTNYYFTLRVSATAKQEQRLDESEIIDGRVITLSVDEAVRAIRDGEITHGPTIQGVLWYAVNHASEERDSLDRSAKDAHRGDGLVPYG